MYRIFRRLASAGLVLVGEAAGLAAAMQIVKSLQESWPGDYVIQNLAGIEINLDHGQTETQEDCDD